MQFPMPLIYIDLKHGFPESGHIWRFFLPHIFSLETFLTPAEKSHDHDDCSRCQ